MKTGLLAVSGPLIGLLLFSAALWVLHHQLRAYHLRDVLRHVHELPAHSVLLAVILTFLSYLMMTGYDVLALRYIQRRLPYGRVALASFVGYAFSNNVGFALLAGASIRYRLYGSWGFTALEITKIVAFCSLTLWLGFFLLAGGVFLVEPLTIPEALHLPFASVHPLGVVFLGLVSGYLTLSFVRRRPLKIYNKELTLPPVQLFLPQMVVAVLDWAVAGAVLYVLLPGTASVSYLVFLSIFLFAQVVGLASQVPGGLGVFEAVVVLLMSPILPASALLSSLLVYRGVYYLFPLFVAAMLLGSQEIFQNRKILQRLATIFGQWSSLVIPHVLALATFFSGAVLLLSGATPAATWRLDWLKDFLPLPVVEVSHFLGSLAGVGLLILARGLQRRVDAAYVGTMALLGAGIVFSLLKGLDYEEAVVLTVMLIVLLPSRGYFHRKASLLSEGFTIGWGCAISLVLLCSVWLLFFSYKHIEYSGDLWWHFALFGDAPRSLRATVGAAVVALFAALTRLFQPAPVRSAGPTPEDLARAIPIVQRSPQTYANLALLGDKAFLLSQEGNAFIMYKIEGRSWVAMGDPVGEEAEWRGLIWRFREMSDRFAGWTVFYEVGPENLPLYLDIGLTTLKLGEEARIALQGFSLEGSSRKGLRHTNQKLEREGCIFEVIPSENVPRLLPDLKRISDAWLKAKKTQEKMFSLGFFNDDYLQRFAAGVIRKDGKIIAFTNIWSGAAKKELSVDLMRYLPEAPHGVMEYLFVQLILWGKDQGYEWFNLGMAPLSGLEDGALAPLWNRVGAFIFRHGEHFYNFQGLRQYKAKFDPEWKPKYLASPGGLALPRIFTNLASLISGGLKGAVTK